MLIFLSIFNQILQPKEVEEVKVVPKIEEDTMKEYRTTTRRHENAKLVCKLQFNYPSSIFHVGQFLMFTRCSSKYRDEYRGYKRRRRNRSRDKYYGRDRESRTRSRSRNLDYHKRNRWGRHDGERSLSWSPVR
ncbi:unnamed protein product [Lactuca saligna]|uniref:Uncharacterized protein n=1 Tax=Lactuca saligna TaxID=75948 RepID=A0AA35VPI8_LACSI|nr:unnamed protein product [Lactuca saligna]